LSNNTVAYVVFAFALAGMLATYRIGRRTVGSLEAADSRVFAICERYAPVPRARAELLILRKVGDEASTALATGAFAEGLTTLAWKALMGLFALPGPVFRRMR